MCIFVYFSCKKTVHCASKILHMDKQASPEQELKHAAEKIEEKDVQEVIEKENRVEQLISKNKKLAGYLKDVKLFYSLLKDYMSGRYKSIPWYFIASITAALLYLLNPLDVIPDAIPIIGFIDDLAILKVCTELMKMELQKYQDWKTANA